MFFTGRGCKPHPNQLGQPWVGRLVSLRERTLAAPKERRGGKDKERQEEGTHFSCGKNSPIIHNSIHDSIEWRRSRRTNLWNNYKQARNDYVMVLRKEQRQFENDIIDRCKNEPKLFYRFVNGKLKRKIRLDELRVDRVIYEDPKAMADMMNRSFNKVFTREKEFVSPRDVQDQGRMEDFQVTTGNK